MFYSKSTGGFYITEIHGSNIPSDAVEITAEQHAALLSGQSEGKTISADENRYPILVDPTPKTKAQLKREELQALAKAFNENKNSLNAAWLAAAVADGSNENTRKDVVLADIAELQTEYDIDCAAVRAKYA